MDGKRPGSKMFLIHRLRPPDDEAQCSVNDWTELSMHGPDFVHFLHPLDPAATTLLSRLHRSIRHADCVSGSQHVNEHSQRVTMVA